MPERRSSDTARMSAWQSQDPDHQPPDLADPGGLLVVEADDRPLELQVVERLDAESFTALAPRLRVRDGLRLYTRVFDDVRAWRLTFVVDRAEAVSSEQAQVTLRVLGAREMGDERDGRRVAYIAVGSVQPPAYDGYVLTTQVHTVDVSPTGMAFECERTFHAGQALDVSFGDGEGNVIVGSVEVVRTAPAAYGQTRMMCRFRSLPEPSRRQLEALIARPPEVIEARSAPAAVYDFVNGLRDEVYAEDGAGADAAGEGRIGRLFRRRG
jgi:hypothetical protein